MDSAKNRFIDGIPFEVIQTQEENLKFQEGKKAAKSGKKRDNAKGLDWILGYDSEKKEQA